MPKFFIQTKKVKEPKQPNAVDAGTPDEEENVDNSQEDEGTETDAEETQEETLEAGSKCPDCDGTGLLDHATAGNSASQPCARCDASGTIQE